MDAKTRQQFLLEKKEEVLRPIMAVEKGGYIYLLVNSDREGQFYDNGEMICSPAFMGMKGWALLGCHKRITFTK